MMLPKRLIWLWMLPILFLAIFLSAQHLNEDAIWFDEWITYFITGGGQFDSPQIAGTPCEEFGAAQFSPIGMVCLSAIDNSWPPAFFTVLYLWNFVSDGSPFVDRLVALWIGLLTISVLYQLGKRLFKSNEAGLMAAALLASSAFFLFYMHEIRGYTLYVLLPTINGLLYWLLLEPRYYAKRRFRWGFALSIGMALYTHYIAIAAVFGIMLYHVLNERPQTALKKRGMEAEANPEWQRFFGIMKLWINGCLLYAPWIAVLIVSFINESITNRSIDTLTLLQNTLYGFGNNLPWLVLAALTLSLVLWRKRENRFLWLWGLSVLGVSILANIYADFLFHPRHIMGMIPAFILLIVATLHELNQRYTGFGTSLAALWLGVGIVYAGTADFMLGIDRHISTIPQTAMDMMLSLGERCIAENDLLVLGIDESEDIWVHDQPLSYYFDDAPFEYVQLGSLVTDASTNPSVLLPKGLEDVSFSERVQAVSANKEHIWLVSLPHLALEAEILDFDQLLVSAGFQACGTVLNQPDVYGTLYSRGACEQACQP